MHQFLSWDLLLNRILRKCINIRMWEKMLILIKNDFIKIVEVFLNVDNYPPSLISFHVYYISRIHVYVQSYFPPLFARVFRYKSYWTLSPYSIGKRPMNKHRYSAKVAFDCHYLLSRVNLTRYYNPRRACEKAHTCRVEDR